MKSRKAADPLKPVTLEGKPVQKIVAPAEIKPSPIRSGERPEEGARPGESPKDPAAAKRREELTALLWGAAGLDLDDEPEPPALPKPLVVPQPAVVESVAPAPARASIPPPFTPASAREDLAPQSPSRRILVRRACSFPGLLRVLFPELSFQPRLFAVRVIDLNPGGAQVETKQLTRDVSESIRKDHRFARLEALLPGRDKMVLSGRVAWTSYGTDISRMGLEFERLYPEVGDAFVADIAADTDTSTLCLGSPLVDPFPSVTSRDKYTFSGHAQDADEIIVRNGTNEARCPVKKCRFQIEIPLMPERSNFLSFTACRGSVYSIPTPACIAHESGATDTMSYSGRKLVEEFVLDADARHLTLRMGGSAGRFFQVLKKLQEALEHVEEVEMAIEMTGDAAKAATILEALKRDL